MEESLNIYDHIKVLIIQAIAKHKGREAQAKALGITSRSLFTYLRKMSYEEKHNKD